MKMVSGSVGTFVISLITADQHDTSARWVEQTAKMGKINIAGYGLAVGALGQTLLLSKVLQRLPSWFILVPLLGPWLLVHVISFCRVPPCGPRRFAQILIIAMTWYSLDTFVIDVIEMMWILLPTRPSDWSVTTIAHALCYGSVVSFIVLIPAAYNVENYEANHPGT